MLKNRAMTLMTPAIVELDVEEIDEEEPASVIFDNVIKSKSNVEHLANKLNSKFSKEMALISSIREDFAEAINNLNLIN